MKQPLLGSGLASLVVPISTAAYRLSWLHWHKENELLLLLKAKGRASLRGHFLPSMILRQGCCLWPCWRLVTSLSLRIQKVVHEQVKRGKWGLTYSQRTVDHDTLKQILANDHFSNDLDEVDFISKLVFKFYFAFICMCVCVCVHILYLSTGPWRQYTEILCSDSAIRLQSYTFTQVYVAKISSALLTMT